MKSKALSLASASRSTVALALACAQLAACIVNQPLGEREDGATSPTDSAAPTDSPAPADAAPMPEDAAALTDVVAPTDAARDSGADVQPTDAAVVDVRSIEISAGTTRPIPALGSGSSYVTILFRDRPSTPSSPTVVERSGDCVFQESRPVPNAPPPTLDGVTIRVSTPGGSPMIARRDSLSTSDFVAARYFVNFPSPLPAGTMLRVEVDAFGTVPAFSRDVAVSDVSYAAPSPITDTAMARYLTRTAGQPMPIALQFSGSMLTRAAFDLVMMATDNTVRELRCELPGGATTTTIPTSLLDRAAPFANTAVGGASVLLIASHNPASTTLSNGTTVTVNSAAALVSGIRF